MSRIVQPDTTYTLLDALDRRVRALENTGNTGTIAGSSSASGGGLSGTTTDTTLAGSSVALALYRQSVVLVAAAVAFSATAGAGGATAARLRVAILDNLSAVVASSIRTPAPLTAVLTGGAPVLTATLAAGSYTIVLQHSTDAGTATITVGSSGLSVVTFG